MFFLVFCKDSSVTRKRKLKMIREEEEEEASRNAHYHFQTDVKDDIKDGAIQREETREGKQVNWITFSSYFKIYLRIYIHALMVILQAAYLIFIINNTFYLFFL